MQFSSNKMQKKKKRYSFGLSDLIIFFGLKGTKRVNEKTIFLTLADRYNIKVMCYFSVSFLY